ncbi:hypothetical protein [Sorangium sp. So ce131]|uniref:hypothetical protein n=1 Tax=Sorangium sp. So ce131 TaxID=3133282 RepID=UPI003F61AC33
MTRWLSLVCLPLSWLGCEVIAGIEDRTFTSPVSEQCASYCATVMQSCTGEHQVYSTIETCQGVCALLDPGDPLEPAGNTVACRAHQASLAASTRELAVHCPRSGPGGDGFCGSDCESYCALYAGACSPEIPAQEDCIARCEGLKDAEMFDVIANHDGDTLQCRLVHVSSATVEPAEHCEHARLVPVAPCADPAGTAPVCEEYCQLVMAACQGDHAVYESTAQCLAVCEALPPGSTDQRTENTVGCRKSHAYSALLDPVTHCTHAGPGGDGHCGSSAAPETGSTGDCTAYCTLLEAACKMAFDYDFADLAECELACSGLEGAGPETGYAVVSAEQTALDCRLLHVSRAFVDPGACDAASGAAPCE